MKQGRDSARIKRDGRSQGAGPALSPPPAEDVRRILVTAYGHTADTLPAGPCLAALRATYPQAELHMLVVEQVAELWRACPHVDVVRVMRDFRHKGTRLARLEQVWRLSQLTLQLRGRYDMVVVLHARNGFFTRLAYATGARYRAGYRERCPESWLTHHAEPYEGIVSFREENRRVLRALGITDVSPHLDIWPTEAAKVEVDRLLAPISPSPARPLIGLHPGSHWACQRWHNERWAAVADALIADYGAQVVITGSADERAWAEDIAAHMHARPLIATGATSLLGFADLVARCQLLICVNSAASQVGLAVRTPVVNLVGLEPLTWTQPEPGEAMAVVRQCTSSGTSWCPLGVWGRLSQCQRSDHIGLAGLDSIHPADVLAAAARWLHPAEPIGEQTGTSDSATRHIHRGQPMQQRGERCGGSAATMATPRLCTPQE